MDYDESSDMSSELEETILDTMGQRKKARPKKDFPPCLYIFPVLRRPFFPGMAAPVMIEPGPYYEALKAISKSDQKFIGVVLTKDENADLLKVGFPTCTAWALSPGSCASFPWSKAALRSS